MEELVLTEAIAWVAEEITSGHTLDVGDIAAYALNRLRRCMLPQKKEPATSACGQPKNFRS